MPFRYLLDNRTLEYPEVISFYKGLANTFPEASLISYQKTDSGNPLHLFVIKKNDEININRYKNDKRVILINNGIHPGEPCGIDASMKIAYEILHNIDNFKLILDKVIICIIPIYNIGGALNRNSNYRVNQNGPISYGFRGNSCNIDLNRDFIKCNSENAKAFSRIFHLWKPDIFIDTHTTNGADYNYTISVSPSQYDATHPLIAEYVYNKILPFLNDKMADNYEMSPFVNLIDKVPENGIKAMLDTPRYSSGYTNLFGTFSFITEAHMLKEYKDRVLATFYFIKHLIVYTHINAKEIGQIRLESQNEITKQNKYTLQWELDKSRVEKIRFKGYTTRYLPSKIGNYIRIKYDKEIPWEKDILFFNRYKPVLEICKPNFYIIPQSWQQIIERLILNNVEMSIFQGDTDLNVSVYYIEKFKQQESYILPYYDIQVCEKQESVRFFKGDYIIPVNQISNRYIVQTLEPQGVDSFFSWHFFDNILQQQENFSAYLFEDTAINILEFDTVLKKKFEKLQKSNKEFSMNQHDQLDWIYKHSIYYEKTHRRYPVYRFNGTINNN